MSLSDGALNFIKRYKQNLNRINIVDGGSWLATFENKKGALVMVSFTDATAA